MSQPRPAPQWRGDWDRALASIIVPLLVAFITVLAVIVVVSAS